MPTLMLTTKCPNSCDWCFAKSIMQDYQSKSISEIKWEDFLSVVEFFKQSGKKNIILLGGEPTLHSKFMDILTYLNKENFTVSVATNGITDRSLIDKVAASNFQSLRFGLNSTSYFHYDQATQKKVDYFLSTIRMPILLSYTISEKDINDPKPEPILDRAYLIMRYSLSSHIQFQIAVPSSSNKCFIPFSRYREVFSLLNKWNTILKRNNITSGLDCHSFPKCALPPDDKLKNPLYFKCANFMIDIGPNLDVWPCFPLSDHKVNLADFKNLAQIQEHFKTKLSNSLVYDKSCSKCGEKRNCDGGCFGFSKTRNELAKQK
ncbi:MAG: radical SAM protein [Candidatus Saganbacteria bacterium]|nr:radical SAM protein [Candidatus Saganbacteria bacterium]